MALSKKARMLLLRARIKAHPYMLHQAKKLAKESTDLQLQIIVDVCKAELEKRGLGDNE